MKMITGHMYHISLAKDIMQLQHMLCDQQHWHAHELLHAFVLTHMPSSLALDLY
jgi:hypothetical protein